MTENETPTEPSENPPATPASARTPRLTAAQEEEAVTLAKELLRVPEADFPAAIEMLVTFPWSVGVAAITGTWPELSPETHEKLAAALSAQKSDAGKRLRLSVARGLVPGDPQAVEQLTTAVCIDMLGDGALTGKDRLTFNNVFIGKGKPWLQNLHLAEWANPGPLIACAVDVCFAAPCLPFTQLSLLRWLASFGWLNKLDENALTLMAKTAKRWNARFQNELKKEVPELPPLLAEALVRTAEPAREETAAEPAEERAEEMADDRASTDSALERMVASTRGERRSSPRERRESGAGQSFDLGRSLREIEAHVAALRRELQDAKSASRQREGGRGRSSRRESAPSAEESSDVEGLQRHNAQLEETVAELRRRLEDLASDHEDRAAASEGREADDCAQLTELLGLKLRESFAEYEALRSNAADEVVRQHFGDMLENIFRILANEGVRLS